MAYFGKLCIPLALSVTFSLAPPAVASEEGGPSFIASVGFQDKELSFDQKYSGLASNDAEFSVHLPTANISFTAAYQRVYLALKLERSIVDTSTTTDETDRSVLNPANANLIAYPPGEVDVKREDQSITVGYNVWDRLNIFVGYLKGETTLNPDPLCANPFGNCSQANYAFLQYYLGQPRYEQVYEEQGPYVGFSYSWQIADLGSLSASYAYADMDGEYTDNANDPNDIFGGNFRAFDYRGDTTGSSLGLTWTGPLGETSNYFIDLRRQQYEMDAKDHAGGPNAGTFVETEETMTGLTAGVQFYF